MKQKMKENNMGQKKKHDVQSLKEWFLVCKPSLQKNDWQISSNYDETPDQQYTVNKI